MSETQIKICGLSTPEMVDAADRRGGDPRRPRPLPALPRHVSLEQAAALRARVPREVKVVLLLVNEQPQPTVQAIQAVRPDVGPVPRQRDARTGSRCSAEHPARDLEGGRCQRDRQPRARAALQGRGAPPALRRPGEEAAGRHRPAFDWSLLDHVPATRCRGASPAGSRPRRWPRRSA